MTSPILSLADIDDARQPPVLSVHKRVDAVTPIHRHAHRRGQLLLVASGLLTVHADTGSWVVPAGTAFWIAPGEQHALLLHGSLTGWTIYLDEATCRDFTSGMGTARATALLREAVTRHAIQCLPENAPLRPAALRLGHVICDEIAALRFEAAFLPMPQDRRMTQIARTIILDPANDLSLHALADRVGISRRTATRRFAGETGVAFSVWRQRVRLMRALEKLAAGETVTETALSLGYDSASAFTAMFKRNFGAAPSRSRPTPP